VTATDGFQYCKCAAKLNSLVIWSVTTRVGWSKFMGGYNTPDTGGQYGERQAVEVGQTETLYST